MAKKLTNAEERTETVKKKKKSDVTKSKKKSSGKGKNKVETFDNNLPQNILAMGERVEENKNIYISQSVYKKIHKFTQNKTTNESGGVLIGSVIEELGKTNIMIRGFVEAKYCEATPTTLKFTHETWEYIHGEVDKRFPGQKIMGWIHTHPDFGIFLSEYDKFIHENFFSEENQIAYVVDPIQKIEGFYFWINGKLEKCKGFYIYDKVGVSLDIGKEAEEEIPEKTGWQKYLTPQNIALVAMAIMVVILSFASMSQAAEIKRLRKEQDTIVANVDKYLNILFQQVANVDRKVSQLETPETEPTVATEPQETTNPEGTTPENRNGTEPQTTQPQATEPTPVTE